MKQNFGYRLGTLARRFMRWLSVWENEMQQRGVPRWVTKIPLFLYVAAAMGLLLAGAFFIAGFLALMVFIAFYISFVTEGEKRKREINGYHTSGPEGPGVYMDGKRIISDDEDDQHY